MDTPKQIGRYEILAELGHGAMGTVYRAKDPVMDREVALKTIISLVLASEQGSEFRERFYREARASGKLAHPGIVAVFDAGEHEGVPYLVMEFVNGRTLADAAKQGQRFTLDRICEIGQQLAEALGHAHRAGVVHRDIKPANILLTSKEVYGIERPKITDFGVAKLAAVHTTMTGQILGTPAFMPPEQFTGAPIDGRADLFSLGVVLYWLATGEQPFPGEGITAVSYKVVHTDPVPPRKLNPSIPAKFEAVIMKCLAKSPDDRYQTGEELARALTALRSDAASAGNSLRTAAPQAPLSGSDPDVTLIEAPAAVRAGPASDAAPPTVNSQTRAVPEGKGHPSAKGNRNLFLGGAVAVVLLTIALVVGLRRHQPPVQQAALPNAPSATSAEPGLGSPAPDSGSAVVNGGASSAEPAANSAPVDSRAANGGSGSAGATAPSAAAAAKKPVAPPVPNGPTTKPSLANAKPSPTKPSDDKKAAETPAGAGATPVAAAAVPAAAPQPAAIDFDPKSLDPKQNAKLKIEAEQWPSGLDFTVEMNGKVYLRRSVAGQQKDYDNLFVPPGVQEFRVTASDGSVQKISNTVSAEFKAKKKNTLRIEFRTQGQGSGSGVPQGLYPNTQIVLTLK